MSASLNKTFPSFLPWRSLVPLFQLQNHQKSIADARAVNREITTTLEAVMSSHSQLQTIVESLQVDLGKKDALISQLRNQR